MRAKEVSYRPVIGRELIHHRSEPKQPTPINKLIACWLITKKTEDKLAEIASYAAYQGTTDTPDQELGE
jgi:hypothetical protein